MRLTSKTKIHDLLEAYPFLVDFLASYNPKYKMLQNPVMRATAGRIATLEMAAAMGEVALSALVAVIRDEVARRTGDALDLDAGGGANPDPERLETLKSIMHDLHAGKPVAEVRQRFNRLLGSIEPGEIGRLEQQLIRDGLPVQEVQRLCDLHVGVFQNALQQAKPIEVPPGHPVDTYLAENRVIQQRASGFDDLVKTLGQPAAKDKLRARRTELLTALEALAEVEKHYARKENQLFSYLEKHGISAPPKVMWGVDDQIRALFKDVRRALENLDAEALDVKAPALVHDVVEMIYKEDKILFPMCLDTFTPEDWAEIRRGEDKLGYVCVAPTAPWPPAGAASASVPSADGLLALRTGQMTLEQVNLCFGHLPVEVTFVDADDEVRFYSENKAMVFPRTAGIIGRKVQNCHPQKSVHVVNRIVEAFRQGKKDVAEFWVDLQGRKIYIRYFAVRDANGIYQGTLEVTQDITEIQKLQGQRRLLDWEQENA